MKRAIGGGKKTSGEFGLDEGLNMHNLSHPFNGFSKNKSCKWKWR
jgi:hypothetical protein